MSYYITKNIKIEGIVTAVPQNKVSYVDFYDKFGQQYMDKFVRTTQIKEIHKARAEQTATDLGYVAAQTLLEKLDFNRNKIGLLVFATQMQDYIRPSDSYVLHYRLGLSTECACIDNGLGCPGFIYSLQSAGSMLAEMETEYALLIVSDTVSKLAHPNDRALVTMLGDAGSAILLKKEKCEERTTLLGADGKGWKMIMVPGGQARYPDAPHDVYQCSASVERTLYNVHMDGMSMFSFATREVPEIIKDYLEHTGTNCRDYDAVCLHQANMQIMKQIAIKINCSNDDLLISIDRYGNTSGVSIPLTLCDFYGDKQGNYKVLACAFGVGVGWGVTSLQIDAGYIFPIVETNDYFKEGKIQVGEL